MKTIAVLGCSGSIGTTTLNIIRKNIDKYKVSLLVNNTNLAKLKKLISEFKPDYAVCVGAKYFYNKGVEQEFEGNILSEHCIYQSCDIVVNGIVGLDGLLPSLTALDCGKILATANKESFVCAGNLVIDKKNKLSGNIYPLDSEHSTVWQLLSGREKELKRIVLTASGGAFRDLSHSQLCEAKADKALLHPNWVMGKKVTVDCATLMNKGMEIIEAKHLFGTKNISVVQHRESIVHSLIELHDNTMLAGLSQPDMTLPIQYALTYPNRECAQTKSLDLRGIACLHFAEIAADKFPCFVIAKEVAKYGDYAGTVMNGANEILVEKYLHDEVGFYGIAEGIEKALYKFGYNGQISTADDVYCIDKSVKEYTLSIIKDLGEKYC